MFCEECGSILRPKLKGTKKVLYCSCGFTKDPEGETLSIVEKSADTGRRIEVMEQLETHPKVRVKCSECTNGVAYFWTQQTRAADEPETRFFKCTKCNHTWREY